MMDWLIVGGGLHGVHIAVRLLEAGVSPQRLRIVDPGERLLSRWRACTAVTGMTHLRSPSIHHLDLSPWALKQFAGRRQGRNTALFAPPYERPALSLFQEHCEDVVARFDLARLHVRGRVSTCSVQCEGVHVQLEDGQAFVARHLVLALGAGEQLSWPTWAPRGHGRVRHIFEPGFEDDDARVVAVVGGGISAGQIALRLASEGRQVHLISRHAPRRHRFDSDPGWLGPKYMTGFRRQRDANRRRAMITDARHRGSMPPGVYRELQSAIRSGRVQWHQDEVTSLALGTHDVALELDEGSTLRAECVLLATGFASRRPGGAMVDGLVASASLPCAQCGYPVVDEMLRWHPRVFVSGPLAELELGPSSRNIAGARRAGDRIVAALQTM